MPAPSATSSWSSPPTGRWIFLDRDGTINVERHYLDDPDQLELLPGAAEGLRAMQLMGFGLVVVTNQSGLARGYFDEARLEQIHARLRAMLAQQGVQLNAFYHCPHHPDEGCDCRKPRTGMLHRAAEELGCEPALSYVIGDKACDVELGNRAGATTMLVRTGYGARYARPPGAPAPDYFVDDLNHAAQLIHQLCAPHWMVFRNGHSARPD